MPALKPVREPHLATPPPMPDLCQRCMAAGLERPQVGILQHFILDGYDWVLAHSPGGTEASLHQLVSNIVARLRTMQQEALADEVRTTIEALFPPVPARPQA